MAGAGEGFQRFEISHRQDWRDWLAANHDCSDGVWVVTWKKTSKGAYVPFGDLHDEALCWGWIDRMRRGVNKGRTSILVSPRKPRSNWSDINKARVAELIETGLMQPPGLAMIEQAKADGSWDKAK
jgi:uncharacterized protein YdeI (YjbR/CyaY-like superfamily)